MCARVCARECEMGRSRQGRERESESLVLGTPVGRREAELGTDAALGEPAGLVCGDGPHVPREPA